ncbi:hypothetical protein Pst134EA_000387 [Puccinia striiformis f. sp. tritici]|uniref:hypothetical protein n=1 Tax=Puccinia striiformis f. sp. tritici TaxID=168172 RepID=UPI002007B4BA|nr:hypothetical protein Pst134EA_000387 [Puccinia striiformis f. sp. tritici]KAH9473316.1 hypothetical protein Pst134EA_000387 [Puccinia striiformis f. sp. tritici]
MDYNKICATVPHTETGLKPNPKLSHTVNPHCTDLCDISSKHYDTSHSSHNILNSLSKTPGDRLASML